MVTGGHIAFQRTAGFKRHTHDDQQRSTTQLDGSAGDVAEDDGEASHDSQEDRADQSDLGQGLRDEIAGGLARTDAGNGTVVFAKLVGNVHGVVLDRNVEVVERNDQQHINDEVKRAVVVEYAEESVQRRLPKRGFNNIFATKYVTIKVSDLEKFEAGSTVDTEALLKAGIISKTLDGVKVLGNGELTKAINVKVAAYTASAKEKIEKAGGKAEVM